MAKYGARRLSQAELEADENALVALQAMDDYNPMNAECGTEKLAALHEELEQARQDLLRTQHLLAAKRDALEGLERAFHTGISTAKIQVTAQYGVNSDEVQSLGLKKRDDYKRPTRRATPKTTP